MPHDEHIERLKLADIFLDCFNYNAHTTASDALERLTNNYKKR